MLNKIVFLGFISLNVIFADNFPWSQLPPGNLQPAQCPMFVCFGFDDNAYVDGITWFADLVRSKPNPVPLSGVAAIKKPQTSVVDNRYNVRWAGENGVKITVPVAGTYRVRVVDIMGKTIAQRTVMCNVGTVDVSFDKYFPNGIKLVMLSNDKDPLFKLQF